MTSFQQSLTNIPKGKSDVKGLDFKLKEIDPNHLEYKYYVYVKIFIEYQFLKHN